MENKYIHKKQPDLSEKITVNRDREVKEIGLQVKDRNVSLTLISPYGGHAAEDPALLMTFGTDRHTSLEMQPSCIQADMYIERGHRVLSFDLPNHGERVNEFGSEIEGLRNAFIHGDNPFEIFVEDGKAAIDFCVGQGIARPGRIAISGVSRAGYMALRLLAADKRVNAGAVFAPVTDWRFLKEFSEDRDRKEVENLRISRYCKDISGRPVFISIGNHDERVSTVSCCKFYLDLAEQNAIDGYDSTMLDFYCTNDIGHTVGDFWRELGGEFLLKRT